MKLTHKMRRHWLLRFISLCYWQLEICTRWTNALMVTKSKSINHKQMNHANASENGTKKEREREREQKGECFRYVNLFLDFFLIKKLLSPILAMPMREHVSIHRKLNHSSFLRIDFHQPWVDEADAHINISHSICDCEFRLLLEKKRKRKRTRNKIEFHQHTTIFSARAMCWAFVSVRSAHSKYIIH